MRGIDRQMMMRRPARFRRHRMRRLRFNWRGDRGRVVRTQLRDRILRPAALPGFDEFLDFIGIAEIRELEDRFADLTERSRSD